MDSSLNQGLVEELPETALYLSNIFGQNTREKIHFNSSI